jgi:hypothetical protein
VSWLFAGTLVACGAAPSGECTVGAHRAAIVNGVQDTGFLGLSQAQRDAIVTLHGDADQGVTCTAVRVAEAWLLTAAHCVSPPPSSIRRSGGVEQMLDGAESTLVVHPERDLALIGLPASAASSAFLGWATGPVVDSGDLVEIAGMGRDEAGGLGQLRFAVAPIDKVEERELVLGGGLVRAPCFGDSGGPALVRDASGAVVAAGILARGSAACTGADVYERLDTVATWLGDHAGRSPPASSGCRALGREGRCFGETAAWCDGDQERGERCGAGTTCGWRAEHAGYRCVARQLDPCAGIDDLGVCEGNVAVRCVSGALHELRCGDCEAECARSLATGAAVCETVN